MEKEYDFLEWISYANKDFDVAKLLKQEDIEYYKNNICFQCHQAIEKYLKGFLDYNNKKFTKTHNLSALIEECMVIDSDFSSFDIKRINAINVGIRYPDNFFIPSIEDIEKFMITTEEIKEKIDLLIKKSNKK